MAWLLTGQALADALQVKVAEPYVEIHTGPGRGYPVFHVVERHAPLTLIRERAGWVQVHTPRGRTGWVPRDALALTLDGTGQAPVMEDGLKRFNGGQWQLSVLMGELEGARSLSAAAGYQFTDNLLAEVMFSQASGPYANNRLLDINVQHQLFPQWRVSPYVMLGTGKIHIEPRATLVQPDNRDERLVHVGGGVRIGLSRGFVLRAEYRNYVLFTQEDDNRNLEEWKLGFAVLF
ncbi:hypothetical protein A11A3_00025 [Alcanivorax hongdengensis A-11-3]|uniref:SH3b domain-containing protein n=1 Tax=Alcanivorax hongdengensis A-11-3 TaxID=1177179 RepID=L0WG62_9GAMM|nr:outer membrane beta-barrel protein [Alcanivorax hongdengensis]EKF75833.1 hypothetical protein A11A3_00025 [Alcanivorax hongdengensis A-11-3]